MNSNFPCTPTGLSQQYLCVYTDKGALVWVLIKAIIQGLQNIFAVFFKPTKEGDIS